MNFTREPIIETIISPREGCKLLVRSSKSGGPGEEYYVDAIEVVSFGRAFFFRSLERPKPFLVPASDYEVFEVKETRVALKTASPDRNIKIGGGREASLRYPQREPASEKEVESIVAEAQPTALAEESALETVMDTRMEKRRDRRRRRHRRSGEEGIERRTAEPQKPLVETETKIQGGGAEDETKVSSSMFSSLIPPPSTLISQTLSRYKDKEAAENVPPEKEIEKKHKKGSSEEESFGSDSPQMHRVATTTSIVETTENSSFISTHFSPLNPDRDSFFF